MTTLDYYNEKGSGFFSSTVNADMSQAWKRFRFFLREGRILDFGCGSGRDARYFQSHGYDVDAVDGSEIMCALASEYTGLSVRRMLFEELDAVEEYDGIWACASILHLERSSLADVFSKMERAVVPGGVIYTSFKYGDEAGWRDSRYFTCFTEKSFIEFMGKSPSQEVASIWTSSDVRKDRVGEKWLNVILRKVGK